MKARCPCNTRCITLSKAAVICSTPHREKFICTRCGHSEVGAFQKARKLSIAKGSDTLDAACLGWKVQEKKKKIGRRASLFDVGFQVWRLEFGVTGSIKIPPPC